MTIEQDLETIAIIPAFNEATRIGNVTGAALNAELVDALVVVDDGSTDQTLQEVGMFDDLNYRQKPLIIIEHGNNKGKTESLFSGAWAAKELGGQALKTLVFLDADSSPIWSRDTKSNMKLWQIALNSLSGTLREPVSPQTIEARSQAYRTLLSQYIDEIILPVKDGQQIMRVGMYERNVFTDSLSILLNQGAHGGNRAISINLWNKLIDEVKKQNLELECWEIEGALEALAVRLGHTAKSGAQGAFMMRGVVNVGSRVKARGFVAGLKRMGEIHTQATRGYLKLR